MGITGTITGSPTGAAVARPLGPTDRIRGRSRWGAMLRPTDPAREHVFRVTGVLSSLSHPPLEQAGVTPQAILPLTERRLANAPIRWRLVEFGCQSLQDANRPAPCCAFATNEAMRSSQSSSNAGRGRQFEQGGTRLGLSHIVLAQASNHRRRRAKLFCALTGARPWLCAWRSAEPRRADRANRNHCRSAKLAAHDQAEKQGAEPVGSRSWLDHRVVGRRVRGCGPLCPLLLGICTRVTARKPTLAAAGHATHRPFAAH
jgi:hypothetical protein